MTNVGEDKDTLKRQREAVAAFAKSAGYRIVGEYSDDGVKGADPVDQRPGFAAMLKRIASNGVRTIIVETASRFARDLVVQETGWRFLREAGINLIAADSPGAFLDETPTAVMIRQILGAVSQFDKAGCQRALNRDPGCAPNRDPLVTDADGSDRPGGAGWGCAAGASAGQ